jgi:hypothetical protein
VKLSRRRIIFGLFFFVALLVGVLFWPFILSQIIKPVAIVVWLLLRILVLSIDQKYYWAAIIFSAVFFLYRLLPRQPGFVEPDDPREENSTLRTLGYWRNLFTFPEQRLLDEKTLKGELVRLLVSFYATRQHTTANFKVHEALQQGELPLPEHIRAYLFFEESGKTKVPLGKRLQAIWLDPRGWFLRLTGQETVKHDQMIAEVLTFMETELEIKNDPGKFNPH